MKYKRIERLLSISPVIKITGASDSLHNGIYKFTHEMQCGESIVRQCVYFHGLETEIESFIEDVSNPDENGIYT